MKKNRYTLFLFSLVAWSSVQAHVIDPSFVTVKVESKRCDDSGVLFEGTGTIFRHKGQSYVITSEHVVLHGKSDIYCHKVYNLHFEYKANLLVAEWGRGVALLSIAGTPSIELSMFDDIKSFDEKKPTTVVTSGFAAGVSDRTEHLGGEVLPGFSKRHFLPMTHGAIELTNAHGEFGYSGGLVYDSTLERVVGLLSHQYLTSSGGRARVGTYTSVSPMQRHLLLIPWSSIREWLLTYFSKKQKFRVRAFRDPSWQVIGRDRVLTSGLSFSAANDSQYCIGTRPTVPGSAGIGGGDPSGTGGKGTDSTAHINVILAPNKTSDAALWTESPLKEFMSKIKRNLNLGIKVMSPFLVYRDPKTGNAFKLCVRSLEEYFRKLNMPGVEPVFVMSGGVLRSDMEPEAVNVILRDQMIRVLGISTNLVDKIALNSVNEISLRSLKVFEGKMELFSQLSASDSWVLINSTDIYDLIDHDGIYSDVWAILYNTDFDDTVDLLKALRKVRKQVSGVRL